MPEQKPNFVIILTDTQGANVVGAYGHPELETVHIDKLAEEGVLFERAYTTSPVCTPARAALFTGMAPCLTGAWTNSLALGQNIKSMGERFQDAGYHTVYRGKWHLDGHDYFGDGACPSGWDATYWYDGKRYLEDLSDAQIALWRHGLQSCEDLEKNNIGPEFTWAHRISNGAIEFLQQEHEKPFLLVASYDEPHGPSTCPPMYAAKFRDYKYAVGPGAADDLKDKPSHQQEWAQSGNYYPKDGVFSSPLYFGCNSYVDAEIGRVIETVKEKCDDRTWIIFTSDHGMLFGQHGMMAKGPNMYEEATRIPLILRPPGGVSGKRLAGPVSHLDIMPTLHGLAGLDMPQIFQGRDLSPYLSRSQPLAPEPVFMEFNRFEIGHDSNGGFQPIRCIVTDRFKLVVNLLSEDELYDLDKDPHELRNLINEREYADARDHLHDQLLDAMYDRRDPFRGPAWERRPYRSRRRFGWMGDYRVRRDDGYTPPELAYGTGKPSHNKFGTGLQTS